MGPETMKPWVFSATQGFFVQKAAGLRRQTHVIAL